MSRGGSITGYVDAALRGQPVGCPGEVGRKSMKIKPLKTDQIGVRRVDLLLICIDRLFSSSSTLLN